ncbi:hypothetical protein V496_09204 [Pseudogymnoascus sp. VKM F-4515 (FW-2607)]|nr:hypothetical protein V496_09204 [Pseudogymnoascus sp. VKM F-4515 (FW-2607)]
MAPRNKLQKYNASFPISRFTLHCIADEVASLSLVILCPSQHGITANIVTGASTNGDNNFPDAVFNYCNVTFAYSHNGADDQVQVWHWLPTPYTYKNRYLSTSGGAYAINSGSGLLPGGVTYGAVAGATGGGFGSFIWATQSFIHITKAGPKDVGMDGARCSALTMNGTAPLWEPGIPLCLAATSTSLVQRR